MWFRLFGPVLIWCGLIFVLSSISNPPGRTDAEWPSYLAHVAEYAGLGYLTTRATRRGLSLSMPAAWAVAWSACVLYGISDEVHQSFVPERHASAVDLAVDAFAAAIGVASWELLSRRPWPA